MSNYNQSSDAFKDFQSHAVIILGSGLSQRLGQPKQLLKKNGKPLIDYMLSLALKMQPHTVVVVIPDNYNSIQNAIDLSLQQNKNIELVVNQIPNTGMGHSLYLAIKSLTQAQNNSFFENVLILGIDQVLLDYQHLRHLLDSLQNPRHDVVASSYSHLDYKDDSIEINTAQPNINGLPIAITMRLLKQWQFELKGDRGLRHLIRALPIGQLGIIVNSNLSYDIDTVQQLSHAKQQGWLDK